MCVINKIIAFLLIFVAAPLGAQDYEAYQKKYWHYRDRLLGQDGGTGFVSIGPDKGQSIPADGRNVTVDCEKDWVMENNCSVHPGTGKLNWGDATAFQGNYMAMLALEYANLQREGHEAQMRATARELHYAINAVARLDRGAEPLFGLEPDFNGFFLRDDIPVDFYKDSSAINGLRFSGTDGTTVECLSSDFSCLKNRQYNSDSGKYISQDQVVGLFFGFSFIKRLIPEVYYQDSTQTFGKMVAEQTDKIMELCIKNNWTLEGPDGEKISNKWGGDFRGFNNLFQKTAVRLNNQVEDERTYKTGGTRSIGWVARSTFDWAFWAQADRNHWMIFSSVVSSGVWNNRKIAKRSLKSDRVMYALAYSVVNTMPLHDKIKRKDLDVYLQTAPEDGPCFGLPDCEAPEGWMSNHRWIYPYFQNGNPYWNYFEWNGIDYMLFYNLYHYLYGQDMPAYGRVFNE